MWKKFKNLVLFKIRYLKMLQKCLKTAQEAQTNDFIKTSLKFFWDQAQIGLTLESSMTIF